MPHMSPFYMPYHSEAIQFYWLTLGSYLATKIFKVESFKPWMSAVLLPITIVILSFVLKLLLSFVF